MPGPPMIFQCPVCQARREVVLVDDLDPAHVGDGAARDARLRDHLRHATCPACGARDPAAIAAHARGRRRDRLTMAAVFAGIAVVAVAVPLVALVPPGLSLLIWTLVLRIRWRRRMWKAIAVELVMCGGMAAWVIAVARHAYVCPAVYALLALWPRPDSRDPFVVAAEVLRFVESPYRG